MKEASWQWTMLKWRCSKLIEKLLMWIAWRLPRQLVMWCYIRIAAHATTNKYSDTPVPEVKMMDALNTWIYR